MRSVFVAMVTLAWCGVCEDRVRARSKVVPACYSDSDVTFRNSTDACSNPLYTNCGEGLCCGPDHQCCLYDNSTACCRTHTINGYELTGIITGALAWLGNLIVIFAYIARQYRWIFKRPNNRIRVAPEEGDVNATARFPGISSVLLTLGRCTVSGAARLVPYRLSDRRLFSDSR